MTADSLLTVEDVADRLSVHPKTVYRWVYNGHIPCRRLGPRQRTIRFTEDDLDGYLEETACAR